MTGTPALRLPAAVDTVDEMVDDWWEVLRGQPALDRLFYAASAAGDFSLIWHAFNLIRAATSEDGRSRALRLTTALALESLVVNQVVKRAFRRARPSHEGDRPHHLRQPSTSSFPSGHASSAAMAVTLLNERGRARGLVRAVGLVVATSRIHVRIHHASDVAVGAALGAAMARVFQRLWPLP